MFIVNADVTRIDTKPDFNLGDWTEIGDKKYRYVKYLQGDNSVSATAGHIGYRAGSGTTTVQDWTVTEDRATATAIVTSYAMACCMFVSALTNGKYGWSQTEGPNSVAMLTDGSIDAGEQVTSADANGTIKGVAAGTAVTPLIGGAKTTDSSTASAIGDIYLHFPGA